MKSEVFIYLKHVKNFIPVASACLPLPKWAVESDLPKQKKYFYVSGGRCNNYNCTFFVLCFGLWILSIKILIPALGIPIGRRQLFHQCLIPLWWKYTEILWTFGKLIKLINDGSYKDKHASYRWRMYERNCPNKNSAWRDVLLMLMTLRASLYFHSLRKCLLADLFPLLSSFSLFSLCLPPGQKGYVVITHDF